MALTKAKKREMLQDLQNLIADCNGLVFTDFKGSLVKDLQSLRTNLRQNESSYKVVKKTLFGKALNSIGIEIDLDVLPGSLGVIFTNDPVEASKVSVDFQKRAKKGTFLVIGGLLDNKIISDNEVIMLSKLPSKEQLQSQLVATIAAPITSFLRTISEPGRGLVTVLSAYKDSK